MLKDVHAKTGSGECQQLWRYLLAQQNWASVADTSFYRDFYITPKKMVLTAQLCSLAHF